MNLYNFFIDFSLIFVMIVSGQNICPIVCKKQSMKEIRNSSGRRGSRFYLPKDRKNKRGQLEECRSIWLDLELL